MQPKNAPESLRLLWLKKFFEKKRRFGEIKAKVTTLGCNPLESALYMALSRADYLTKKGQKGNLSYVQKYPPTDSPLMADLPPEKLIKQLGSEFETEIKDLGLNYGRSGSCTAFLLRKILEKLIFLAFAKNGLENKLKDDSRDFVGLKTMLSLAAAEKVHGKPFLMPKTAKQIEGIKFLGDTAAHNPLINVDMKVIVPQMPFILTAYEELSTKL